MHERYNLKNSTATSAGRYTQSHDIAGSATKLQELTMQQNQHKSGWQTIRSCYKEILKHDLEWAWVDTCCIDKTSSVELMEAIHSMYRRCQFADACFAYTDDASKASDEGFGNSAWFTRSRTLQELLAPHDFRSYGTSFEFISEKKENAAILQSITGILETVLNDPRLVFAQLIAERMSWAATRNATKVEDMAYDLFGIFEVDLLLLYGESTQAFTRLQRKIIRQSADQSVVI